MIEWHPIDTAPKDRKVLIKYTEYDFHSNEYGVTQWFKDGWYEKPNYSHPTHWAEFNF